MNTDYRAARIQGKRNEKFGNQNVFRNLKKKALTESKGPTVFTLNKDI